MRSTRECLQTNDAALYGTFASSDTNSDYEDVFMVSLYRLF